MSNIDAKAVAQRIDTVLDILVEAIITLLSVTLKSSSLNCWLRTALITLQNPLNLKPRGKCSHIVSALSF